MTDAMNGDPVYWVCIECAHFWQSPEAQECENCTEASPYPCDSIEDAEDVSQSVLDGLMERKRTQLATAPFNFQH